MGGFRFLGLGFLGLGVVVRASGFRVEGFLGLGCNLLGLGFKVSASGVRLGNKGIFISGLRV